MIKVKKVSKDDGSIIVVVSDISRMKDLEKVEKKLMSVFF
jgi:nickel-dependent lactate racemase